MKFITRGFHHTITACTLPIWTPESIVDLMITYFGSILRAELVHLLENPQSFRSRAHSTGSNISYDSSDGQNPVHQFDDSDSNND